MPNQSLLESLDFTKSVGNLYLFGGDVKFNDACKVGGFPFEQRIVRILKIEVYAQAAIPLELAVIDGLVVTYIVRGSLDSPMPAIVTVKHGIVEGEPIGTVQLKENELVVGASGKLKDLPKDPVQHRRLSFIAFYVFNKDTGLASVEGPFGSLSKVCEPWGNYGPVIAFQGTENPKVGLTSLGFTRLLQGVPDFGITDK